MDLLTVLVIEVWALLGAFAVVVAYQILTGRINTRKLLSDKKTGRLSPARIQVLLFTVGFALYFVSRISETPPHFPEIPNEALMVLFGSNVGYLGFKGKGIVYSLYQSLTQQNQKRS